MNAIPLATRAVLRLLVNEDRPWTVEEIAREIGNHLGTVDAIAELQGAGLVNRITDTCVVASRAATTGAE